MEGELIELKCIAIGYPAYSQIKTENEKKNFEIVMVLSESNMSHIGKFETGTLITNQTILPVGEHELRYEMGFLLWRDNLDATVQDSSSTIHTHTHTIVASMVSTSITVIVYPAH